MRTLTLLAFAMLALSCSKRDGPPVETLPPEALPPEDTPPAKLMPKVATVTVLAQGETTLAPATQMNLFATRDAVIRVRWKGDPGTYDGWVEFRAPSGDLYTQVPTPVVLDESRSVETEARLAIAGSPVQNYGLTGTWEARVMLRDERAGAATFAVNR